MNIFENIKKLAKSKEKYKLYIDYNRPRIVALSRLYKEGTLPQNVINDIEGDNDPIEQFNKIFSDIEYQLYKGLFNREEKIVNNDDKKLDNDSIDQLNDNDNKLDKNQLKKRFNIENISNKKYINIFNEDGDIVATYDAYITEISNIDNSLLQNLKLVEGPNNKYYTLGKLNNIYNGFEYNDNDSLSIDIVNRFIDKYYK